MRILAVNWQDLENPQAGGAEIHLHEILERVAARGHQVTLLCGGWPGAEPRVGCAMTRPCGPHVIGDAVFRLRCAVRYDDGRTFVSVSEMNAVGVPFAAHDLRVGSSELDAGGVAFGTRLEDFPGCHEIPR